MIMRILVVVLLIGSAGCSRAKVESLEHMNKGVEFYQTKQYNLAIKELEEAIRLNESNEEAYYNLSIVHIDLSHWSRAAQLLTRAVVLKPNDANYHFLLGRAYQEMGELEQARSEYENSSTINPAFFKPEYYLGMVLADMDKPQEAFSAYTSAIMKNARYVPAYTRLGNIYAEYGFLEESRQVLSEGIKVGVPGSEELAEVHKLLGTVHQELGNLELAAQQLKMAIDIKPMQDALFSLGWTYAQMGSKENARIYLERFIKQSDEKTPQEYIQAAQAKIYEFQEEPLAN
ncbi:MAG: tetratricopeptide repeat protein [Pseudomonadota bacterium]